MEGRAGADEVRLTARYSGPRETGFSRSSSWLFADASWSHAITDRLSAVLTASHVLKGSTSTFFGEKVNWRSFFRGRGPTVNLALTYSLGRTGQ